MIVSSHLEPVARSAVKTAVNFIISDALYLWRSAYQAAVSSSCAAGVPLPVRTSDSTLQRWTEINQPHSSSRHRRALLAFLV